MKIHGQYTKPTAQDRNVQGPGGKDGASKSAKAEAKGPIENRPVTQNLTLNKVRAKIDGEPDVNLEKVKALKERIKKGEYQVDSAKLAANLLKDSAIEDT
ncbi:MAG: flagellar biosynthesis anti-sigma factor FlgM [bacterium]|nr:flagellar biosynthesis anti-sigma factor FlgM [bacterium]